MANHTPGGGRPRGHPPTAIQCALAVVTAGLAVAAAMLALVETAQASYLASLPQDEPYLQSPVSALSNLQAAPTSTPSAAQALCPPTLPATYSGTVRVDDQPVADALTLAAASDVVGRRLRSDVRIIETAGVVGNDVVHAQAQRRVAATGGPELNANGPLDTLLGER